MLKLEIKTITSAAFISIIESEKHGKHSPFGLFLVKERPDLFIACDNSEGDARTEEFTDVDAAKKFLLN